MEKRAGGLNAVDDNLNFSRAAGTCDKEAGLGGDERIQQLQGELIGSEIGRIEADERVRGRDSEVRRCVEIELIGTIAPLVRAPVTAIGDEASGWSTASWIVPPFQFSDRRREGAVTFQRLPGFRVVRVFCIVPAKVAPLFRVTPAPLAVSEIRFPLRLTLLASKLVLGEFWTFSRLPEAAERETPF